jgi:hypothetical protein
MGSVYEELPGHVSSYAFLIHSALSELLLAVKKSTLFRSSDASRVLENSFTYDSLLSTCVRSESSGETHYMKQQVCSLVTGTFFAFITNSRCAP